MAECVDYLKALYRSMSGVRTISDGGTNAEKITKELRIKSKNETEANAKNDI
jgi:hypothetical protein